MNQQGGDLTIEVVDDGTGIQQTAAPRHTGLRSMQERAAAQGGTCSITSRADHPGTIVRAVIPTTGAHTILPIPADASDPHDQSLTALRQQLDSVSAAAGEARHDAWVARYQLRTAMEMVEALLDAAATVESVTLAGAEMLGRALRAGSVIHLLSSDREHLLRSASWHADPEHLAALNNAVFSDRPASTPQERTALASGEPVLGGISTLNDIVRQGAPALPLELHSYIVAPLIAEGTTLGTVSVVRDQTPETFRNDDVEFVRCASAQIGIAILRARARS